MKTVSHAQPQALPFLAWPFLAWPVVVLTGVAAPALAMLMLLDAPTPAPLALAGGPLLAVGLMGVGMIGAADFRSGVPY